MRSCLLVVRFGKPLNQVFKDISHIHGADLLRPHVCLVGAEVHNHLIEQARLLHAVNLGAEIHASEDVLHVIGKAVQVGPEVVVDVLRIRTQGFKGERAGVIELVSGGSPQEPLLDRQMFHLFVCIQHRLVGRQQAVVEPLDDHHRQDHQAVLVGFVRAKESVCHIPDEGGLLLYIFSCFCNQRIAGGHDKLPLYFSTTLETQHA